MEFFKYNPTPYVNTQVDLPLDFIQGQLETRQKEFDAQTLAVDKAAENFMKINPGRLTKAEYDRVMKLYLPQIEKIRDTLHQTGNIAMAAPALSKFTMNLAADPSVKNIMEDYKLTEAYNKNLQEGKYTDQVFAGLFDPQGNPREQLTEGQMTSGDYYSPMQYTDPLSTLMPRAEKVRADIYNEVKTNATKYGILQTDDISIKRITNEKIKDWVDSEFPAFKQNPLNKAFFWTVTGYKPETYTKEMWTEQFSKPIADALETTETSQTRTHYNLPDISIKNQKPPPTDPAEEAKKKAGAFVLRTTVNGIEGGFQASEQGRYQGNLITNLRDFNADIDYTKKTMQSSYAVLAATSNGTLPGTLDVATDTKNRGAVRNWINDNYEKDKYGQWVVKPKVDANGVDISAAPITPDISTALNQFTESNYANHAKDVLLSEFQIQAGVKDYNPAIIEKANYNALRTDESGVKVPDEVYTYNDYSTRAIDEYLINNGLTPSSDYNRYNQEREKLQSLSPSELSSAIGKSPGKNIETFNRMYNGESKNPDINVINKYIDEATTALLVGTKEGKIHKVFENYRKKLSSYQLSTLPGDGKFPEYEKQIINMGIAGQLPGLTTIIDNIDAAEGDGLTKFKELVPYKDGKPESGINTDEVFLHIGYSPKNGVVGALTMAGKYYSFDIGAVNVDQMFTSEYPELVQEMRIYRDISKSVQRSQNTEGKFNIGSMPFEFKVRSKKLASDAPEFTYEFSPDGVNTHSYTNVGEIIAVASDLASKKLDEKADIIFGMRQAVIDEANRKINALPMNTSPDVVAEIKRQADLDMQKTEAEINQIYNNNTKPVGGVGKPIPQSREQGQDLGWTE